MMHVALVVVVVVVTVMVVLFADDLVWIECHALRYRATLARELAEPAAAAVHATPRSRGDALLRSE